MSDARPKLYRYVGPPQIAARVVGNAAGTTIAVVGDILRWVRDTG